MASRGAGRPKRSASSQYLGVFRPDPKKARWAVEVTIDGRGCHVVNIDTEDEAARIYDRLALFHLGPDAELNFPRSRARTRPTSIDDIRAEVRAKIKKRMSSRYRGVYWKERRQRWGAQIYRGKVYTLGSYTSEREAARAYDRAARALFGKDAKLNFPNEKLRPATPEVVRADGWRRHKAEARSSVYSGVSWVELFGKWGARSWRANGKPGEFLGYFEDEEEAARACDRVAISRGFPRETLNFPDESPEPATVAEIRAEVRARVKARKTSRYRGVCWSPRAEKWRATIRFNSKNFALGFYDDEAEAARAFDRAAIRFRGSEAKVNFEASGRGSKRTRKQVAS